MDALLTTTADRGMFRQIYPFTPALVQVLVGVSSGAPFALIAATLTTRLAQDGIDKRSVTAFATALLIYNFKFAWAWIVDGVRLPLLWRLVPVDMPTTAAPAVDLRVLAFATLLTFITAFGFGVAPMLRTGAPDGDDE